MQKIVEKVQQQNEAEKYNKTKRRREENGTIPFLPSTKSSLKVPSRYT